MTYGEPPLPFTASLIFLFSNITYQLEVFPFYLPIFLFYLSLSCIAASLFLAFKKSLGFIEPLLCNQAHQVHGCQRVYF